MPIRPYIAPLVAVTGATRQAATCDYTDWCNTSVTLIAIYN